MTRSLLAVLVVVAAPVLSNPQAPALAQALALASQPGLAGYEAPVPGVPVPRAPANDRIADYLMDEDLEIALARSGAPDHVGAGATVWVLRSSGYEIAVEGDNGFHCLVIRSFAGPNPSPDPRTRGPACFNPTARDSVFASKVLISREFAAGTPLDELKGSVDAALASGELSLPEAGAFAYMVSGAQWLNPRAGSWYPHLMFYAPDHTNADAGGGGATPGGAFVFGTDAAWRNITVALEFDKFVMPRTLDRSVLDDPRRPERDREQDPYRKALDVYEWMGVLPGMSVADVFAGNGYNTQLLGRALGERGHVHAVTGFFTDIVKARFGNDFVADLDERLATAGLDNVTVHSTIAELPEGSLDAVVSIRNYHDIEWFGGDPVAALSHLHKALRPGGIVGVVEVATHHPGWHEETHRIHADKVIAEIEAAGFVLIGRSDMLASPDDDHSAQGFDVGREKMDRYLLKFRKIG